MRIAIVGAGVAGLTAAYRLHRDHEIVVFEANDYAGGHTATVDVEHHGQHWAIDTGFIVFNDWTYPRFIALLEELGVASQPSNMSFSVRCERSGFEYNGTSLNTLFAQRSNAFRPAFLRMLLEILRFNRAARTGTLDDSTTLREYLDAGRYSHDFRDRYLVPMGRAVWSATESALLGFPARFFIDFFHRHGFLSIDERPVWRAVRGGSRTYVERLVKLFTVRMNTPVAGVRRDADVVWVRTRRGDIERFDQVILACHSDQALALLEAPTDAERRLLGAFAYQRNEVVLHTDASLLPRRPLARAAWNYHILAQPQAAAAVTYDMNVLQSLSAADRFMVTLNHSAAIDPASILRTFTYHHPVYTLQAVDAQRRLGEISGQQRTFYCGAYWASGFHEDAVVSGERAAADLMAAAARPIDTAKQVLA
ncbi:putative NAD/FAD-binding protein [Povalibacter uvarum]|uniref:Putative NAD/FAD-binding protein n=1 Tax=Povalibacter uvarum TaxID=732238 RepID=A0A841HGY8_9GAMM|nr:FAD-dependent oxidoreductase [Povalibacter uvarum]MBB6092401.1 putative NAD/FAD-binding protein [Povalibacter uvarum]